ncbi:MAG: HlyD family efflux transporter periplasmic adaptor subunit [Pseudomonadota bacterium]
MRFLARSLTALFLFALTGGLLAWAGQITLAALEERAARDARDRSGPERVLAANVVTATPATIAPTLTTFGEVLARRVLELRVPVNGPIVELADGFEEGGVVEAGQVLLRIDPAEAEAALAVAQADLAGAEAEVRDAARTLELARAEVQSAEAQRDLQRRALDRALDLADRGVGSAATVETAELALQAAEQTILSRRGSVAQAEGRVDAADLGVARAQIAVSEAQRDLDDRILRAAFSGRLTDVTVLEGGLMSPNERVATLIDPTSLEVAFRLSAAQHARLLNGAGDLVGAPVRAVLEVSGLALAATGTINREAPSVGEGQTGRLVFATLGDSRGFRPGDFVRVEVEEPPIPGAIDLPASALSAQSTVLVLGTEDRLDEVAVSLLRRQGDRVLVAGNIANREVVAERTVALGAGIKVRPIRAGQAALADEPQTVALDPERRARLKAIVDAGRMPSDVKARIRARLDQDEVPAEMIRRLEARAGG